MNVHFDNTLVVYIDRLTVFNKKIINMIYFVCFVYQIIFYNV